MIRRSCFRFCLETGWLLALVAMLLSLSVRGAGPVPARQVARSVPGRSAAVELPAAINLPAANLASAGIEPALQVTETADLSRGTQSALSGPLETATLDAGQAPGALETPALTGTLTATQTLEGLPLVITATATLLPFPTITYDYPRQTATNALLSVERPPGASGPPKDPRSVGWKALENAWPLVLLLIVWVGLAAWFLVAYGLIHRK